MTLWAGEGCVEARRTNRKLLLNRKLSNFGKESQGNSNQWNLLDLINKVCYHPLFKIKSL